VSFQNVIIFDTVSLRYSVTVWLKMRCDGKEWRTEISFWRMDRDLLYSAILVFIGGVRKNKQTLLRWEDNIEVSLGQVGCESGRWTELSQDCVRYRAVLLVALNLRILLPEI
jgi:hypothetical protein